MSTFIMSHTWTKCWRTRKPFFYPALSHILKFLTYVSVNYIFNCSSTLCRIEYFCLVCFSTRWYKKHDWWGNVCTFRIVRKITLIFIQRVFPLVFVRDVYRFRIVQEYMKRLFLWLWCLLTHCFQSYQCSKPIKFLSLSWAADPLGTLKWSFYQNRHVFTLIDSQPTSRYWAMKYQQYPCCTIITIVIKMPMIFALSRQKLQADFKLSQCEPYQVQAKFARNINLHKISDTVINCNEYVIRLLVIPSNGEEILTGRRLSVKR